jgi:hypothetical protein
MAAAASAAAADTYRLAGVIELGERKLAMLELPDQRQVTVELGDMIGDAKVAAVDRRSLTLQIGAERLVLTLAGVEAPAPAVVTPPQVVSRAVDVATLRRLAALRETPAANEREILSALNDALGLPVGTQVTPTDAGMQRVAGVPARELLNRLYERLASGQPVKLYLEGSSADEIYLLPKSSGS